ncbi:hypothetical protein [Halomonas sp. H10-9-1]|uniref:hypothetical protein n=1 Tax=Halomonas sp. H10-9-1 TaxID=2950871 RepID=UPI0032DEB1DE
MLADGDRESVDAGITDSGCSLAFVFHDALLPVIMIFTVLVGVFIMKNFRYGVYVILVASSANAFASYHKASEYLNFQDERGGQLASLKEVSEVLKIDDVEIVSST